MWIVHLRQETANIGETEFDPPVLSPVEPRQSLAIRVFQKTPDLVFGPRLVFRTQIRQELCDCWTHFATMNDQVNQTVILKEFGSLKPCR